MQSAVSPFTVRDLRGGPLEICRTVSHIALHVLCCQLIIADHLLVLWRIFVASCPFPSLPLGCWSLGKYGSGKLFPLIQTVWRCQLAAAFGGGSRFQGCHGYLPFRIRLLLPANLSGTSSQAHLFVMSLKLKTPISTLNINPKKMFCPKIVSKYLFCVVICD